MARKEPTKGVPLFFVGFLLGCGCMIEPLLRKIITRAREMTDNYRFVGKMGLPLGKGAAEEIPFLFVGFFFGCGYR